MNKLLLLSLLFFIGCAYEEPPKLTNEQIYQQAHEAAVTHFTYHIDKFNENLGSGWTAYMYEEIKHVRDCPICKSLGQDTIFVPQAMKIYMSYIKLEAGQKLDESDNTGAFIGGLIVGHLLTKK